MAGEYEPRYSVGDHFRDGSGVEWEIGRIFRARPGDDISTRWAVGAGFASYEAHAIGRPSQAMTVTTRHLHEMIDAGYLAWAYTASTP